MAEEMNHEESLKIINSMIQRAQNKMTDNSIHYLIWGYMVSIAALAHYTLLQFDYDQAWLPWPVLMTAAGIFAGIKGAKKAKQSGARSYTDRLMSFLWGGMVVVMLALISQGAQIGWDKVYPIFVLIWAWALFVSGGMLRFKPLLFGAFLNLIIALVAFYQEFEIQLLLLALSMIGSYLVPAYMLKRKIRNNAA